MLPIRDVHESPLNPRKHFDEKALGELADNIRLRGILSPLLVRPIADGFEIGAGHRRFRAAGLAGLTEVPALVRVIDDDEFLELLTIENLHRDDLHPLEEAEGYQTLMDRRGYDVETLAAKIGKSLSYVYQRLKLLALVPAARKAFLDGKITAGHAVPLARLTPADQKVALDDYLLHRDPWEADEGLPSVQAFRAWIGRELILDLKKAPFDPAAADLVPKAGACAACPKRSGAQPALFDDLPSRDLCTDRICHAAKVQAHIAETTKQLAAKGAKVVRLSTNYHLDPEERRQKGDTPTLPQSEWKKAGAIACDNTAVGIIVSGYQDREGGIGKTFKVCTSARCKTHAGRHTIDRPPPKPKTPAERRKERDALDADQIGRLTLANLNEAIVARARAIGTEVAFDTAAQGLTELLRIVACGLVRSMWHDTREAVVSRHGWRPEKNAPYDVEERVIAELGQMRAAELLGTCVEFAIARSTLRHPNYLVPDDDGVESVLELTAVAELLGLDVDGARQAAEAKVGIDRAQWNTEQLARDARKKKAKAPAKKKAAKPKPKAKASRKRVPAAAS